MPESKSEPGGIFRRLAFLSKRKAMAPQKKGFCCANQKYFLSSGATAAFFS